MRLGELAVREGVIARETLKECLALQKELRALDFKSRIGRLLVEKGYLTRPALAALLAAQARWRGARAPAKVGVGIFRFSEEEHQVLVERLVADGILGEDQVERCLRIQAVMSRYGIEKRWTEVAMESRLVDRRRVRELVRSARRPLPRRVTAVEGPPSRDSGIMDAVEQRFRPDAIRAIKRCGYGRLVVKKGYATPEQVKQGLYVQLVLRELGLHKRIGEILVARGDLTRERNQDVLEVQAGMLAPYSWLDSDPQALAQTARTQEDDDLDLDCEDDQIEPKTARDRPRYQLGDLAVYNKILTREQVDHCIEIQAALARCNFQLHLGQVFLLKRYVDTRTLDALVRAQFEGMRHISPARVEVVKFTAAENTTILARVVEGVLVPPEHFEATEEIREILSRYGIELSPSEILHEMGRLPAEVALDILVRRSVSQPSVTTTVAAQDEEDPGDSLFHGESGLFRAAQERIGLDLLARIRRFRLGRLAIFKGLATPEDIKDALTVQIRLAGIGVTRRLGEILVDRGVLSGAQRDRLLEIQRQNLSRIAWSELDLSADDVPAEDRALTDVLVDREILSEDQVHEAAFIRKVMAELGLVSVSLGEVLVDRGFLDREVFEILRRGLAPELTGPIDAGDGRLRSERLREAYEEILEHERFRLATRAIERRELAEFASHARWAPIRSKSARRRRWSARAGAVAAALLLATAAIGGTLFGPRLLEGRPRRPPAEPPPAAKPRAQYEAVESEEVRLEGRVTQLGVYPVPDTDRGEFDFVLDTGEGGFYLVRGSWTGSVPGVPGLERLQSSGRRVAIEGTFVREERMSPAPLPDGSWTQEFVALSGWSEAARGAP